jgi:hypothetical protein
MRDAGYREALLAYIDILGFRKLIETSATNPSVASTILKILRDLKTQTSGGGRIIREQGKERPVSIFRAFNFSDLTVRATFIDTRTDYVDVLKWEFLYLSAIQVTLTCQLDIVLRGAISIGQISMEPDKAIDDEILFGPALVRSYLLEKDVAIWPRIIIDSAVIHNAKQNHRSLWQEYIHKDEDGQLFVDYLFGAATDGLLVTEGKSLTLEETLKAHKDSIERKVSNLIDEDARIFEKLRWLVSYHNGVVRRLQELHSRPPDQPIPPPPSFSMMR